MEAWGLLCGLYGQVEGLILQMAMLILVLLMKISMSIGHGSIVVMIDFLGGFQMNKSKPIWLRAILVALLVLCGYLIVTTIGAPQDIDAAFRFFSMLALCLSIIWLWGCVHLGLRIDLREEKGVAIQLLGVALATAIHFLPVDFAYILTRVLSVLIVSSWVVVGACDCKKSDRFCLQIISICLDYAVIMLLFLNIVVHLVGIDVSIGLR